MKKFFKNRCVFGFVVIVIVFSIIIGIVHWSNPGTTFGENITNVIVTPVQNFFSWIGNGISDFFGYFGDKDELNEEIARLKQENTELKNEIGKNELAMVENKELRGLLGLKEAYPEQELKYAMIIARDPSNWYNTFTIDKGSADGIAVNQPVIAENKTLVGRIVEVGTTWSKVITIFDPEHAVGAVISRSGESGFVEGDADLSLDGYCKLSYISKNSDVVAGDSVMTAGLGGVFPEGLIIGKVKEVKPDIQGTSQYALVEPAADIENIRAVCVIQNPTD